MRLFFLIISLLMGLAGTAQTSYQSGLLPAVNVNKKLSDSWKLNFKTETRHVLREGRFGENQPFRFQNELIDFSVIVSRKTGLNNALAGGYLIRIRNNQLIHRLIQQWTINQRFSAFRLAHRFSADQTFASQTATELRLRYRISAEFPLNGQEVDPKEFYIKVNHEYLNAFQGRDYDLEIRVVPLLGYEFTDNNKVEAGLDYRMDSFLNTSLRTRFWMNVNWFIAF